MQRSIQRLVRRKQKALAARVVCVWEILLAYACILVIDSACLFPAVWVR
jgi:hypothetical protein